MHDYSGPQSVIVQQIEKLGSAWRDMSDARFWNEADARAYLLWLLCQAAGLDSEVSDPECGGKVWKIPLAHAECLGAKGRGRLQGTFDIVVFATDSIQKYIGIRWDRYGWQERLRDLSVMAAIELKNKGKPWSEGKHSTEEDLEKLLHRMQTAPIQQGYLVVLYDAENYPLDWDYVSKRIKEIRDRYPQESKIAIYFFPWSRQPVEPKWFDINTVS